MSAGRDRSDRLFERIAAVGEEVYGLRLLERMKDPYWRDLPVRHHVTGKIVAYIPAEHAEGACPIIDRGVVIGYYRQDKDGSRWRATYYRTEQRGTYFFGWTRAYGQSMTLFDESGAPGMRVTPCWNDYR